VHTFTGAFTDAPYYDERVGSRAVAQQIGALAHEIEITPEDYLAHYGKVVYLLDEPTLGTGALPTYMTSMLAARHVKVVLTGHGGDEMFAGYQVNKVALLREASAKGVSQLLSALMGVKLDELSRFLYYWLYPIIFPEVRHGLFIMVPRRKRTSFFTGDFLERLRHYEPLDNLDSLANQHDDLPGESLARLYLKVYLPTLLNQEDRMSMGHSIESRTPMCDNELLDLSLRIPLDLKLMHRNLKAITKEALKPYLPEILYRLDKRGFPTPFSLWYRREPLKSMMRDLLLDKRTRERGIFNVPYIEEIFCRNLTSKSDNLYDYTRANILWSVGIVEAWFRTFIDPVHPTPIC
jgi:asparagine synthase (glutamine-hydrolysing)